METFEIYVTDLKEEVQEQVLKFLDVYTVEDGNYDVVPLFILEREVMDENQNDG